MGLIAEKINRFNAYVGTSAVENRLLGVTAEVTLPDFEQMSETLSLSGMAGEIDSPSTGQFQSATVEIPFTNVAKHEFQVAQDDGQCIILRSAQEQLEGSALTKSHIGREITIKGITKSFKMGSLKKAGYGNPSITKEVIYYKDVVDGVTVLEIDKINGTYIVNDVNMMEDIDALI